MDEIFRLSKGIELSYKKFIEPKLSKKQKVLLKELSKEIYKDFTGEELIIKK